ncbi:MAG: Splicing factor [Caeruleum heppii]|nr:MAG: Splicing factor [Caeruleum heppii]KAI9673724.1 MAG: Splicing factor [Caeruleum heppii]
MDIHSLLSPQESPATDATPKDSSPNRKASTASSRSPNTVTPQVHPTQPPPTLPHNAIHQAQQTEPSPPLTGSSTSKSHGSNHTPPTDRRSSAGRQGSTPGMDTLADLASMQHHQQAARANANGLRSVEVFDSQQLPTGQPTPLAQALVRPRASTRGSIDLKMVDAPVTASPARTYTASSLSDSDLQVMAQLVSYIAENPYAYESHVQLVNLLHQGFISHLESASDTSPVDPHSYDLLDDLRRAREAMDSRFQVGEQLWADWISDEMKLASNIEERIAVMELCKRAVEEEHGSTTLWLLYSGYVSYLHSATHPDAPESVRATYDANIPGDWTEEEKIIGAEVFGWVTVLDVWTRASRATEWRMNDSHLVWDKYIGILVEETAKERIPGAIANMKQLFQNRLRVPHAGWDDTLQIFSRFISDFDNVSYEETMVETTRLGSEPKAKYRLREDFEFRLSRAQAAGDRDAEWAVFSEYLDWEVVQTHKQTGDVVLCNALFERATIRFAINARVWEDYVYLILEKVSATEGPAAIPLLPVLRRATSHCPWSGTLWSQRLLSLERADQSFQEVEDVKHKATSMGLMDIGGMEEVLKVHTAWCGYLNRRAFHDRATDEEADVAEVGIRSALESVKELGEKKYGKKYQGDPAFRLERIYIEYLSRSGLWDHARKDVWQPLIATKGESYEFWLRWYQWEMMCWSKLSTGAAATGPTPDSLATPSAATKVLQSALKRHSLDWPEKILEVYVQHVEDHESVDELQRALILARRITKGVAKRREREAREAAAAQQAEFSKVMAAPPVEEKVHGGKRKRDAEVEDIEGEQNKKSRPDDETAPAVPAEHVPPTSASLLKRDRENTTVIVRNLPTNATETRVRQYFRDCGTINSLRLVSDESEESKTATIEFDSKEDVLSAQTRDMKSFEGNTIEVQVGTGSTLYVTNFPASADEDFIRGLFKEEGEIVDVRFPSLKYNTHRRFCYVQFRSSGEARRATRLDGKQMEGDRQLVAKISDPAKKKERKGAVYEGRELYIANLDWNATEEDVKQIFSKYGTVESVRIPRKMGGGSKGMAFVVFSSKDQAEAALEMNLVKFKTRLLNVSLAVANPTKRQATTVVTALPRASSSPTPEARPHPQASHQHGSPAADSNNHESTSSRPSRAEIESRTVALLNVPDTINDTRIRAIMSPYGPLTKIVLRPDHQGALVEYENTQDAGKAALGVEGYEITEGRKIGVGTVATMMQQKAEVREDRIKVGGGGSKSKTTTQNPTTGITKTTASHLQPPNPIRRPNQPGARRGGRGGLGIKRGGAGLGGSRASDAVTDARPDDETTDGVASEVMRVGQKSNADFRALLGGGK